MFVLVVLIFFFIHMFFLAPMFVLLSKAETRVIVALTADIYVMSFKTLKNYKEVTHETAK